METDVTSCLLEEKASSHDPVAFCPSHSISVFVTESLRTVHDYVHLKSVFVSVVFFFLIVLAHRRSGFCLRCVVVDESLCLSPGLFLCHLRCCLFPLIFVGRSSLEGLRRKVFVGRSSSEGLRRKVFVGRSSSEGPRRKVFVGSFRCGSRLVKATFLFIVDHSIVILVLQIKLVVMIIYLLNSMLPGFSVLFTDPVYDDDHIFKADVLPNAE